MEYIRLQAIEKKQNRIEYTFQVSQGLSRFFSGKPFWIEYPVDVESVPDGIAAVPFAACVLPLIWVSDATLEVPELDKAFYGCIPELKKGYEAMYPETSFAGRLEVGKRIECQTPASKKCAAFFSGGLDSVLTLLRHLEEKPDLISIWGSDVTVDNEEGWKPVDEAISAYTRKYDLNGVTIRSAFRDFDLEWELDKVYMEQLKANWWYGMKHGLALLGHAAPYAYLKGISTVYIASSNSPEEVDVRCASDPTLDNLVRFAGCRVIHDGYEFGRQAKVHQVVEYVRKTGDPVTLHVCWESQEGHNCCECEKCYRTMVGLMAEGEDPGSYGFEEGTETLGKMRQVLIGGRKIKENVSLEWINIRRTVEENREMLKEKPYWKYIRWVEKADFAHYETLKLSAPYRLRVWLSQFPLLQKLYNLRKLF